MGTKQPTSTSEHKVCLTKERVNDYHINTFRYLYTSEALIITNTDLSDSGTYRWVTIIFYLISVTLMVIEFLDVQ